MLWKKTQHHQLIYSFVAFLFFSFLFSAGLSHDSYAVSYDCSYVASNLDTQTTYFSLSSACNTTFETYSENLYYLQFTNSSVTLNSSTGSLLINSSGWSYTTPFNYLGYLPINSNGVVNIPDNIFSYSTLFYVNNNLSYYLRDRINVYSTNSSTHITSISLNFRLFTELPSSDCPEPEEPDCPEPETPYGSKLDDIKKAIYVCGAVLIMLYFFFCIYKIIVKDGGSR